MSGDDAVILPPLVVVFCAAQEPGHSARLSTELVAEHESCTATSACMRRCLIHCHAMPDPLCQSNVHIEMMLLADLAMLGAQPESGLHVTLSVTIRLYCPHQGIAM